MTQPLEVLPEPPEEKAPEPETAEGRRGFLWKAALAFVILALAAGAARYYLHWRHYETTDDAFIDGSIVEVAPQVAGRIAAVRVSDNQWVERGAVLVELDRKPLEARLAMERAQLELARARLKAAQHALELTRATATAELDQARAGVQAAAAGLERARAEAKAAWADAERAEADRRRYEGLDDRAISEQQRDRAVAAAKAARARAEALDRVVAAAEAELEAARARLAGADTADERIASARAEVERARAEVARAQAAVEAAELDLSYATIHAPVAGHVVRVEADPGEFVRPGQTLMALVPADVWVTANFKETQLTDMRPGQPAEIRVDAYPDLVLRGHVDSIQRGTGAQFSLFPPENATGSYVKVVQRVPVKIVFDEPPEAGVLLAPGMSVVPSVRVR
ncbi:MAG: HlyD family secretion protein [Candidatus Dadabacteria bacterium]|nr:MAG: HlyD family secretion protein [Candidatus Dadabacteria bacterium]